LEVNLYKTKSIYLLLNGDKTMVNWGKALANGGVAFFTSLAGILSLDILTQVELPPIGILVGALISGGIMAGLAICKTWQEEESENPGTSCKKGTSYLTLF